MDNVQKIMQDTEVSLKAKALYVYFLSISKGQAIVKLNPTDIQKELKIGSFAYYSSIHDLQKQGYLIIRQTRDKNHRFSGVECEFLGGKEND